MNCQLCQKELNAYLEGKTPESIRTQVETHLDACNECSETYHLLILSAKVMEEEKKWHSNPFLGTRIMSGIEGLELNRETLSHTPYFFRVLKPLLIGVSISAAIYIGVMAGSTNSTARPANQQPLEMIYMNDAALESVDLFSKL
jgi:predicted anti-sigma-YlaC factor YlaD